jgi:hypothetical protein
MGVDWFPRSSVAMGLLPDIGGKSELTPYLTGSFLFWKANSAKVFNFTRFGVLVHNGHYILVPFVERFIIKIVPRVSSLPHYIVGTNISRLYQIALL